MSGAVYGQPVDLWRQETDPRWKGPYINEPWGKGKDQLIRDAWGNAIKFKMKGTVSEAAYLRVLSDGIDQGNFADDLFIDIHAHEWQEGSLPIMDQKKTQDTEGILERIQKALLGPEAFDASGRRIIGGYLGDLGNWPEIHNKWAVNDAVYGQPINLWLDEAGAGNGFHWRGPYIPKPANQLKDAWGNPIGFKLASDELFIVSGGPDGDLSKAKDNISKVIQKSDWQAAELTVQGWIHNDRPDKKGVTVTISVYHRPKDDVTADVVATEVYAPEASSVKFNVVANGIICGKRMLVLVDGIQRQVRNIFIGAGGTQSPAEDRLKFYLR
ncbi:MAG: hypothetical protein DDT40_00763 [candidate division WS2 bacterium]|nr:hypothetical protein [Candidatus Psychracetigena formicireducens]